LEDIDTGKKSKAVRYFKAKVLDTHLSEEINQEITQSIDSESIVFSDKSSSYVDIADFVELHITEKSDKQTTAETLKWVHIAIGNAKRNLLGNYHKIKRKYLQLYLNEFVYKLNRRYFGERIFDRLVIANITTRCAFRKNLSIVWFLAIHIFVIFEKSIIFSDFLN